MVKQLSQHKFNFISTDSFYFDTKQSNYHKLSYKKFYKSIFIYKG